MSYASSSVNQAIYLQEDLCAAALMASNLYPPPVPRMPDYEIMEKVEALIRDQLRRTEEIVTVLRNNIRRLEAASESRAVVKARVEHFETGGFRFAEPCFKYLEKEGDYDLAINVEMDQMLSIVEGLNKERVKLLKEVAGDEGA